MKTIEAALKAWAPLYEERSVLDTIIKRLSRVDGTSRRTDFHADDGARILVRGVVGHPNRFGAEYVSNGLIHAVLPVDTDAMPHVNTDALYGLPIRWRKIWRYPWTLTQTAQLVVTLTAPDMPLPDGIHIGTGIIIRDRL